MKIELPVVSSQTSIQEVRSRLELSGRGAIFVNNGNFYGLVPQWKIITAAYAGKQSVGEIQPEATFIASRTKAHFDMRAAVIRAEQDSPGKQPAVAYTRFRNQHASRRAAKYGVHILNATKERAVISGPDATVSIFAFARKRCYCTNPRQKPPHDYDPGTSGRCYCGYPIVC